MEINIISIGSKEKPASEEDVKKLQKELMKVVNSEGPKIIVTDHELRFYKFNINDNSLSETAFDVVVENNSEDKE